MQHITLQFSATLNDFLSGGNQGFQTYEFTIAPSIKDVIESRGVPHPEVRLILADGEPVGFDHQITDGSHYQIYPPETVPDLAESAFLPFLPPGPARFILDVHLGGLARMLRMLGFDCLYETEDPGDAAIAALAHEQYRIALSRDIGLLKRSLVTHGYWVRARHSSKQLLEVIKHYQLGDAFCPFSRCINCNHELVAVRKEDVLTYLPEGIKQQYHEFVYCKSCDQCFWKGSHYRRMREVVAELEGDWLL